MADDLTARLEEAVTVLDESFHREAVAAVMYEAAAELSRLRSQLTTAEQTIAELTKERDTAENQCADAEREANRLGIALDAGEQTIARLREALTDLIANVDTVCESSAFKSVFTVAAIHGLNYNGPQFELTKARAALSPEEPSK